MSSLGRQLLLTKSRFLARVAETWISDFSPSTIERSRVRSLVQQPLRRDVVLVDSDHGDRDELQAEARLAADAALNLGGNQLTTLPAEIGQLTALQSLDLSESVFGIAISPDPPTGADGFRPRFTPREASNRPGIRNTDAIARWCFKSLFVQAQGERMRGRRRGVGFRRGERVTALVQGQACAHKYAFAAGTGSTDIAGTGSTDINVQAVNRPPHRPGSYIRSAT
jgi:hypothetical protein